MGENARELKICFVGSARYGCPLDATHEKKFSALSSLGKIFVVGFSRTFRPRRFAQHARFYLFPEFPLRIFRYLEMFLGAPFLLLWLSLRHDVSVFVAQGPFEGVAPALVKKIARCFGRRIVLILESHGDFEESFFLYHRLLFPRVYRKLMKAAAGFSFRHADLLRVISQETWRQVTRWAPGIPVAQFMAWTDINVFFGTERVKRTKAEYTFLYAGTLTSLKGLMHLMNAFADLAGEYAEARLILIGREQDSEYLRTLKEVVMQHRLEPRVTFVPEVPQQELARWMARADVFVLPSLSEGLGRVVVEAMATGMPVIGSRVGGIPEILQDRKTGFLVSPGDEAALAEKMRWALAHPERMEEMGQDARIFAQDFFSEESYVQGYAGLMTQARELLSSSVS